MKKRLACALLALVLLVGLVPVTASAAENKISEAAITVLKQLTTFKNTCYYVTGSEYRTGYGTVCKEKHHFDTKGNPIAEKNVHKISEKQADTALRAYLTELDKQVNNFASKNGLTLKQNQHDALVVYTHGAGTAWLGGTGALKSAIVSKASTNELLNVMSSLKDGQYARHQVEVNMYVNGIYSNVVPAQYKTIVYDVNAYNDDGTYDSSAKLSAGNGITYSMRFDASQVINHITASRPGYRFLGWYTTPFDGVHMPVLNAACVDDRINPREDGKYTLYAYWQSDDDEYGVHVEYTMHAADLMSTIVYVRPEDTSEAVYDSDYKKVTVSGVVEISKNYLDANGYRWGFVSDKNGWVKVGRSSGDSYAENVIATAIVTYNGYLNVRNGAGTDYRIVGALVKNDNVKIYEIKTVNGHRWGRCDAGWICLTYTNLTVLDGKTVSDEGVAAYAFTGKVSEDVTVYTAPGDSSQTVEFKDAQGIIYDSIPSGSNITISNLSIAAYVDSTNGKATWAKATWKNTEKDKNNQDITVVRGGWIPLSDSGSALGNDDDYHVQLDPVKYTVVSNTTNVRKNVGDAAELAFSLNKGTEVEVKTIRLVGENIWGKITVLKPVGTGEETKANRNGWINLASKYVKRSSQITMEEENKGDDHNTGLIATVVGTDSVRVRKTGGTYGAVIGSLSRGTTVRVWESKSSGWYKLDTNQNGVYDYSGDGWVSKTYLDVREGTVEDANKVTDTSGNTISTDGTGTGIVANTYSGVNVRQGAGTSYAAVGKLLPGTQVEILEVKNGGAARWGRTDKGWVCMDYISMVKYNPAETKPVQDPSKGTLVDSLDKLEKTTTTAIYTGKISADDGCDIWREPAVYRDTSYGGAAPDPDTQPDEYNEYLNYKANFVRHLSKGTNVTIHELAAVTRTVKSDKGTLGDSDTVTTITSTTYWARTNDGWIPAQSLKLNALDEQVHTVTGADTLKVRQSATQDSKKIAELEKGDQVKVTALEIENDKVWGRIEIEEGTGWIRMDYMTEGAYYVNETTAPPATTAPTGPVMGSTGNTGTGGFVTNSSGYKYKGKVIRANEVNVRATASTSAKKTTTLRNGADLVIYETTISENMAWGRCDAGWIYLYYVDLTPCVAGAVDARVVYNDNTVAYSDVNCTTATGTYSRMSVVDIYEIVGKMAKTDLGWINVDNLL